MPNTSLTSPNTSTSLLSVSALLSALLLATFLISGCQMGNPPDNNPPTPTHSSDTAHNAVAITCPKNRSQVCTREYDPVCAMVDAGVRCVTTPCPSADYQTKSNACTACADPEVISYTRGACTP